MRDSKFVSRSDDAHILLFEQKTVGLTDGNRVTVESDTEILLK